MRNLIEYPITYSEAIHILDLIQLDLIKTPICGDIRPAVLQWTKQKLLELQTQEFFKE